MDSHFTYYWKQLNVRLSKDNWFSVLLYMEKNDFFQKHQSYYPPNLKRSMEDSYLPANLAADN